jgi:hypothetical protein
MKPVTVTKAFFIPRPRLRKWVIGAVIAFPLYAVLGFLAAPAIIKWQLLKRLPILTHRQAAIGHVKVNPFVLSLGIHDLALTETNGEPFASFAEFRANFQLSSIFRRAFTFKEITLREPFLSIVRRA